MRYSLLTSLFATLSCLTFGYGEENVNLTAAQILLEHPTVERISQKIYVQPSDIYFSGNQIFVQTPKGLMPVEALKTDAKGIHYRIVHPQSWVCTRKIDGEVCNTYNAYNYYCESCGYSPYGEFDPDRRRR